MFEAIHNHAAYRRSHPPAGRYRLRVLRLPGFTVYGGMA